MHDDFATLDPTWLKAELKRYKYKPMYTMEIVPNPDDRTRQLDPWALKLLCQVPDSRWVPGTIRWSDNVFDTTVYMDPKDERNRPLIMIGGTWEIPDHIRVMKDSEHFLRFLQRVIYDLEVHESREWLRQDDVLVDDPHAARPAERKVV